MLTLYKITISHTFIFFKF